MSYKHIERTALFVDGANFSAAARALGVEVDYKRLLEYFSRNGPIIRAFYYTAMIDDHEFSPLRPLVDWLEYNGYTLITKTARVFTDSAGNREIKGNMDVEIAVDMLEMAAHMDHAVIFSGDGDFRRLIEAVQRKGVRTTVVSTLESQPPMMSDILRRQTDVFLDLNDLSDVFRD